MKKYTLLFCLLIFTVSSLYAYSDGVKLIIRYYDKKINYPGSNIFIKVEIKNDSSETFRFKVADSRFFNIDFEVKTLTNIELHHSEEFIIQRNSIQPVFFREMSLEPGEEYAFVEELSRFVELKDPGVYLVKAEYYPELNHFLDEEHMQSNILSLSIKPSSVLSEINAQIDEETGEILTKEAFSPDQVVSYMLNARQKGHWDKFFLYLDLEKLMIRNNEKEQKYIRSSDEKRQYMLNQYKNNLRKEIIDNDILIIPNEFNIIKTSYTAQEGIVDVIEKFVYPDFTEIKKYKYYLHRKDIVWTIYNYQVQNLGTE